MLLDIIKEIILISDLPTIINVYCCNKEVINYVNTSLDNQTTTILEHDNYKIDERYN